MATLPEASVTLDESASAFAAGADMAVVIAVVPQSGDFVPRVAFSTQGLLDQYGYCQGVDYAALHFAETRKPVVFVGCPVDTAGAVGRQNNTNVTGNSSITVSAASSGIMEETDGKLTIVSGGTVGTDQIVFDLTLDGGQSSKRVRLGTSSSYPIPMVGIVLGFGAGTLNLGDYMTFHTTAPLWSSTALDSAQAALAGQQNGSRSWMVIGEVPNNTFAGYIVTAVNNYDTENQRFVYARTSVPDRLPLATKSSVLYRMTGAPTLTFDGTAHTITRSTGSFVTDGFAVNQVVTVSGSVSNEGVAGALTTVTATVLTFASGLTNEGPSSGIHLVSTEGLTFAASGHTITRAGGTGNWLNDGFAVGDLVTISGTTSNNGTTPAITVLTSTVMTFGSGIVDEGPLPSTAVTMTKGQTVVAWVAAETAAFASVDGQKRIDISLGRGRKQSPITGWSFRRPAAWAASLREYSHDVQIPSWRKSDGPLSGWSLVDNNGNTVEFDERYDGGGLAGRFTCMRSYGNGPIGAFIALSLTRDTEGALLSRTQNMAVADLAETVVQAETENAIGQVLVLNPNGTGTDASLALIEGRVNTALQINLLQQFKEGPRASSAVWTASRSDVLDTAGATLHGTLALNLNGTLENIDTVVRVQ
jgi:hypothetical protein